MKKYLIVFVFFIALSIGMGVVADRLFFAGPNEPPVEKGESVNWVHTEFSHFLSRVESQGLISPIITRENIGDYAQMEELTKYLYAIESDTYVTEKDLDVAALMAYDLTIDTAENGPKVLVFHTHSQEFYLDSRQIREDSVVGIGDALCRILEENYGIQTIHDDGQYDVVDGQVVISGAYERMAPRIEKILAAYPSIEVCIDLHRDITPGNSRLVWEYEGKSAAKIMFFNGMSRTYADGVATELTSLPNPYLSENLAFSLQMKLLANEKYPDFTRKNYIRAYRYSLYMRGKSLLIEFGTDQNTVEEAYRAVEPLAAILAELLLP